MATAENLYAVLLHGRRVGTLRQRGDHTRFLLNETYLHDANRPVLGLRFEENLGKPYSAALRLPRWFSNLLPEGPLREWIAAERRVSLDREMELLAQVGHDLPGAVQVRLTTEADDRHEWSTEALDLGPQNGASRPPVWRFSLAGVALKFSMLARGDRLTVPATHERGDWLVKFPDYRFPEVPRNEYAMMTLASAVGIDVPEVRLLPRDDLVGIPQRLWPNQEEWAYAVKRFDRLDDHGRSAVHMEDFAQVRDIYPQDKYDGGFETVAALAYRGRDLPALREFARRLAFYVLIGNGDAHLKNWSLVYPDRRVPTLSPAYDIVSTPYYRDPSDDSEDLGLKFAGTRRFADVTLASFARLESRLDARFGRTEAGLVEIAAETAELTATTWRTHRETLATTPDLAAFIDDWIITHHKSFLRAR